METVTRSISFQVKAIPGKGMGLVADEAVKCGRTVLVERPFVIGPKQSSPRICVQCLHLLEQDGEQTSCACQFCGLSLCEDCKEHDAFGECELFQEKGVKFSIQTTDEARKVFSYLTQLRLLLRAEKDASIYSLDSHLEAKKNTLIYCFNHMNVARPICKLLPLSAEDVQVACGMLDTNCYDLSWGKIKARALYKTVARINHSCQPNCWKFFDSSLQMHVVAARDIAPGEEINLSYTPVLVATPVRQILLQQTKHFTCGCDRCLDPSEMGSYLAALKCPECKTGVVLPIDPRDMKTDLQCGECQAFIQAEKGKMMLDTAMKFTGRGSGSTSRPEDTQEMIEHLQRLFLHSTHNLIMDLQMRYINQVLDIALPKGPNNNSELSSETAQTALQYCINILNTLKRVENGGTSRLKGIISHQVHRVMDLVHEDFQIPAEVTANDSLVLSRSQVDEMFLEDEAFHTKANNESFQA